MNMRTLLVTLATLLATVSLNTVASAQDYKIQRGDTLRVEVREDPSLNRDALVMPDGQISLPQIGTIRAAGRTVDQLSGSLVGALAPNFASPPSVFVSLGSRAEPVEPLPPRTVQSFALGEVETPGVIEMRPGTTLLQFISQAGGMTRFAAKNRVQLRRTNTKTGQETVYVVDLRAIERGEALTQNYVLRPGDVVFVPTRKLFE
jgi:polysaccharide export outer membrane protein